MPPLDGAEGPITTYQLPSVPGATFVITKAADEVEQKVIMEMMDYIFTPGRPPSRRDGRGGHRLAGS